MTRPDRPAQSGIRDGLDPQQLEAVLEMVASMESSARLVYELAVVREAEAEARRPPSADEQALLGRRH